MGVGFYGFNDGLGGGNGGSAVGASDYGLSRCADAMNEVFQLQAHGLGVFDS